VVTVTFDMTFGFLSQFALCFDVVGSHTLNFQFTVSSELMITKSRFFFALSGFWV